ncbi:baseplate assembly protein [Marinimicrobium sp. ARAG 43.8]|uniref:baseplate assembly protein n=1 Tax=Marinimicrobium sp. ARAG 43.8 TaxID=3418719 RepID=UPI003CF8818F
MSSKGPIDLSRIPAPDVVEELDFETLFNDTCDDLIARDPQLADVLALESEPLTKLVQVCAYREMLVRQRVNEAARAVMLAYALNGDLDNLGVLLGVERLVTAPGDNTATPPVPPTYETDEDFRLRIQLALDGLSTAGPERAYVYHALSVDGRILDATADAPTFSQAEVEPALLAQLPPNSIVLQVDYDAGLEQPMPGDVVINILSRDGDGHPDSELVNAVGLALSAEDLRPMTDRVNARGADILPYQVNAQLYTYPGPDTDVVLSTAQQNITTYVTENKRLGRAITRSGIYAALHVAGVQRVEIQTPSADINCTGSQAAHCTDIDIEHGGVAT